MKKIAAILCAVTFIFAQNASADVLCYAASTKAITVEASCTGSKTRLSGANLANIVTKGVNYSKCYTQSARANGAPSNGQVSVALSCKTTTDVVVSHSFDPDSVSQARPTLRSQTLIFAKGAKAPTGMQFEAQGAGNVFYTIDASIVCCPQ